MAGSDLSPPVRIWKRRVIGCFSFGGIATTSGAGAPASDPPVVAGNGVAAVPPGWEPAPDAAADDAAWVGALLVIAPATLDDPLEAGGLPLGAGAPPHAASRPLAAMAPPPRTSAPS